ncbi:MAG: glycosyltransferase family 2 protein [Deltaproteobacteria bacterium]|nr:glycosyltransferase family 2 protein [Deltaproteobacteria bacterium]MBW2660717.1 glycosyltransferase family 2 protein [Deltaproteobacteria bacterium]
MASKICVVIPAYNSPQTIGNVVKGSLQYISDVIVADDGSTDNTADIAAEAGAQVILIDKNLGKGNALKVLFQKAIDEGYDAVISVDADGQHNPADIPRFIALHHNYPESVIVGSRMHDIHKIPRGRYNSMHVARFYVSLGANQFIEDTQSGFRLYPLSTAQNILLTADRFVPETEFLLKAGDSGFTIRSLKIETIYNGNVTHFKPVTDIVAISFYVISYLPIKWFLEAISSDRLNTYSRDNLRDFIGKNKSLNMAFEVFSVLTVFLVPPFFMILRLLLSPFIKNNFASTRKLHCGFFRILITTYLVPLLLIIAPVEKFLNTSGVKVRLVDRFLKHVVPSFPGGQGKYML